MKLHNSLAVIYETQILENGRVIKTNAPKRNLLLDSGLDGIATHTFWDSFSFCVLGDGTKPTKRDSGAVTVSITNEVATASAGFFEAEDLGRILKLDSGQEVYISGFTSTTEVAVAGATDEAASEFTIWYVDEVGHENEIVRTKKLGSNSDDVETTWTSPVLEMKRTFIFPVEGSSKTYKEIGWSHSNMAGGNLFGRDLIPNGGDSISEGQQYKVIVKLQLTLSPVASTAASDVGNNGFNTSGDFLIAGLVNGFKNNGDIASRFDIYSLEPSNTDIIVAVATADFTLPATLDKDSRGPAITKVDIYGEWDSYVPGSFEKIIRATFSVSQANGTLYGCGFSNWRGTLIYAHKFTTPQTKDSDHTLELAFKFSWGRTLIN